MVKKVYGTETCSKCKKLVKELKEKGEVFKYIGIDDWNDEQLTVLSNEANSVELPIVIEG